MANPQLAHTPKPPKTVKVYPDLLLSFYAAGLAPVGLVYQIMRAIDQAGRGWLGLAELRSLLTDKRSPWHIYGLSYFGKIMRRGDGIAWHITANGRVRYMSPDKILATLDAGKLRVKPALLPVKAALLSGIQAFKAHILEAWHAGRGDNPISQAATRKLTGVPEATQRRYNNQGKGGGKSKKTRRLRKLNGVSLQRNDAIGGKATKQSKQGAAWQRSHNVQTFTDFTGKMGAEGEKYLSWRLPNSHKTRIQQTVTKGRQKKINKSIALVIIPARGKNDRVDRLYYQDGGAAGNAYNRNPEQDCYWPMVSTITRTIANRAKLQQTQLWAMLPGQE